MWRIDNLIQEQKEVHVVPTKDIAPHDEHGVSCWCHPEVEEHGTATLIVHHAGDSRELTEAKTSLHR